MAATSEDRQLRERMQRIEHLLAEVDRSKDPQARDRTREIVQILMDMHGAGLQRILEHVAATGQGGLELISSMAEDDMVAGLLLLYGQHPLDLDTRVRQALEKVRPYLRSHGGNVELLSIAEGVVNLKLVGSCHGCPSSAMTLKQTIEEAIYEKAPDVAGIEVVGETDGAEVDRDSAEFVYKANGNGSGKLSLPILAR